MTELQQSVIDAIASRIDGKTLIERMGHHPESIRLVGSGLKCFCPIHKDTRFASLLVDLQKRTFKCTSPTCAAFKGGTILQLYGLHSGRTGLESALGAARLVGLKLDAALVGQLLALYRGRVDEALSRSDFEGARAAAEEARSLDEKSHELQLLLATIEERAGNIPAAAEIAVRSARAALQNNQVEFAAHCLKEVALRLQPNHIPTLLALAETYDRQSRHDEANAIRLKVCDLREKTGRSGENIFLLETVLRFSPSPELSLRLARTFLETENYDRAIPRFEEALHGFEARDDEARVLEVLATLAEIDPNNWDRRQGFIALLEARGESARAAEESARLGEAALGAGNLDLAELCFQRALKQSPDNLAVLDGLVALYARQGNLSAQSSVLIELANAYRRQELDSEYEGALLEAAAVSPGDVELQEKVATLLIEDARTSAARKPLSRALALRRQARDWDACEALVCGVAGLPADALRDLLAAIREAGEADRAGRLAERVLPTLEVEDPAAALAVCTELIESGVASPTLGKAALSAAIAAANEPAVRRFAAAVFSDAMARAALVEAESALSAAISVLPPDGDLLLQRAELRAQMPDRLVDARADADTALALLAERPETALRVRLLRARLYPEDAGALRELESDLRASGRHAEADDCVLAFADAVASQGEWGQAIEALEAAVAIKGSGIGVLRRLAIAQATHGDMYRAQDLDDLLLERLGEISSDSEAEALFAEVLGRSGNRIEVRDRIAEWYSKRGRTAEAVECLLVAARTNAGGDRDHEVNEVWAHVLELAPARHDLRLEYGRFLASIGDPVSAHAQVFYAAGGLRESGDLELAAVAASFARTLRPAERQTLELHASILERLGDLRGVGDCLDALATLAEEVLDLEGAIEAIRRRIAVVPSPAAVHRRLAGLLRRERRTSEEAAAWMAAGRLSLATDRTKALEDFREALALRPEDEDMREETARALAASDLPAEAAAEWLVLARAALSRSDAVRAETMARNASDADPSSEDAALFLFEVLESQGNRPAALEELKRALAAMKSAGRGGAALDLAGRALQRLPDDVVSTESLCASIGTLGDRVLNDVVRVRLLRALDREGRSSEAQERFRAFLAEDPDSITLLEYEIETLERQGGLSSNGEALAGAIEKAAALYGKLNMPEKAAACHERLLEWEPLRESALRALAQLRAAAGDNHAAARHLVELSLLLRLDGRLALAVEAATEARRLEPASATALRALAEAERDGGNALAAAKLLIELAALDEEAGNVERAMATLGEVIALQPQSSVPHIELARLQQAAGQSEAAAASLRRAGSIERANADFEGAVDVYTRLIELVPGDSDALLALGGVLLQLGRDQDAYARFEAAAQQLNLEGRNDAALAASEHAVAINPSSIPIRTLRAGLLEAMDRNSDAAREQFRLYEIHLREGDLDKAALALEKALILAPLNLDYRDRYAPLLLKAGRRDEACEQFEMIAFEHELAGRLLEAMEAAEEALRLNPARPAIRTRLASIAELLGDMDRAAEQLQWLGRYYLDRGAPETALDHLESAAALKPQSEAIAIDLARARIEAGVPGDATAPLRAIADGMLEAGSGPEAIALLERSRDRLPEDTALRRMLADLYEQAGLHELALAESLQVVRLLLLGAQIDEARQLVEKLYESEGQNADFREGVALIYRSANIPELALAEYEELARLFDERDQADLILATVEKMRAIRPNDLRARRLEASALIKLGMVDRAFAALQALGEQLVAIENFPEASDVLKRACDLKPKDIHARKLLTHALRFAQRSEDLQRELRVLADLCAEAGQPDEVVKALREVISIRPDDTRSRLLLIEAYKKVGPEKDLLDDYVRLAEIHYDRGAIIEARKLFEQALAVASDNISVRSRYVDFLFATGDNAAGIQESSFLADLMLEANAARDALAVVQFALKRNESDAELLFRLARIHAKTNARGIALKVYRQAAEVFAREGKLERRIAVLREYLRIDPQNPDVAVALIESLEGLGMQAEAIDASLNFAAACEEKGIFDLAEAEYRRVLGMQPDNLEIWEKVLAVRSKLAAPADVVPDRVGYARALVRAERVVDALSQLSTAIQADPDSIDARREYVKNYPAVGKERDIAEDILALADLLSIKGELDEALEYYGRLVTIDPSNTEIRDRMTSTRNRKRATGAGQAGGAATPPSGTGPSPRSGAFAWGPPPTRGVPAQPPLPRHRPFTPPQPIDSDFDVSGTQYRLLDKETKKPEPAPSNESEKVALNQIVNNYRDILAVNANNAQVRIKLADVLEQVGDIEGMLRELSIASDTLYSKGDLNLCVAVCERIRTANPRDQKNLDRLNKAINRRDAFKAIESAILYSDLVNDETQAGGPPPPKRK